MLLTLAEGTFLCKCLDGDVELYSNTKLYDKLYTFYLPKMPYGIAKARTGDPDDWILERLEHDLPRLLKLSKLDILLFQEPFVRR